MSFSDSFTGTNGTTLPSRSGWTQLQGSAAEAVISSNKLARTAFVGGKQFYATGDDGATSQSVTADILGVTNVGTVVLGSVSAGAFSGYYLRAQTGLTACRLNRVNADGAPTTLGTSGAITDCTNLTLTSSVNGSGNVVLTVFQGATQLFTVTDSSASRLVTGQRGIVFPVAASGGNPLLDNYSDNYSATTIYFSVAEQPSGFVWGGMGTNAVSFSGTYVGTAPSGIKARITSGGTAVSGFDWQTVVASPSGNTFAFAFANVPVGGPYKMDVRFGDDAATQVGGTNDFYSGACVWIWGQSQADKLRSTGSGTLSPTALLKASVLRATDELGVDAGTTLGVLTSSASTGSGLMAAANQWMSDTGNVPIMFVDVNYPGVPANDFINDVTETADGAVWGLWSGLVTTVATAAKRQADVVVFFQGTSDVGNESTYAAKMDSLLTKFDALIDTSFVAAVMPHPRSNDDNGFTTNKTWAMRNVQYAKAISGGPWRVLCWLLDWQLSSDGDPHQVVGAAGNVRAGTRIGRGLASLLYNSALDRLGPQITAATFTSAAKTAIDLTLSADVETPSGATTNLPQFYVSTNAWAATSGYPDVYGTGFTAAITAARNIRVTKTSGDWTAAGSVRVDYCRDVPWDTDGAANGGEASVTSLFDTLVYDTSSFDGGRGMPLRPVMGTGMLVSEFGAPSGGGSVAPLRRRSIGGRATGRIQSRVA